MTPLSVIIPPYEPDGFETCLGGPMNSAGYNDNCCCLRCAEAAAQLEDSALALLDFARDVAKYAPNGVLRHRALRLVDRVTTQYRQEDDRP